jgi:3' terminal RNA ribose 2'-O-methyltransferase Hen1
MLLTLTTTHQPATDLGYLLHKHPERTHEYTIAHGRATVLFPEATEERCTMALVLEIDPVGLVRGDGARFDQYVNDRPYVANSILSTALNAAFRSAMKGQSKDRPELAETAIPLEATIPVLPVRGGEDLRQRLFAPLGYAVEIERLPLDDNFPEWGEAPYFRLTLRGNVRLADLLNHLYVLIPVLDDEKHYYVGEDEVAKLLAKGETWLAAHPERGEIARRYLRRSKSLAKEALDRLSEQDGDPDPDAREERNAAEEERLERPMSLHDLRLGTVFAVLKESGARRVLDLGCGEGKLLEMLLSDRQFSEVVGMDVSIVSLDRARRKLRLDRMPPMVAERLTLLHGSLLYRDRRLDGYDAAAVVEVIEHLDEPRLAAFEQTLFGHARPGTVVVTTPNQEYNVLFTGMKGLRHRDHRFEWTREEFRTWAERVASDHGYEVVLSPLGPEDETHGASSQMAMFTRSA